MDAPCAAESKSASGANTRSLRGSVLSLAFGKIIGNGLRRVAPLHGTFRYQECTLRVLGCTSGAPWGYFEGTKNGCLPDRCGGPEFSQETLPEGLAVPEAPWNTARNGGVFTLSLYIGQGKNPEDPLRSPLPDEPTTRDRTLLSRLNCQRLAGITTDLIPQPVRRTQPPSRRCAKQVSIAIVDNAYAGYLDVGGIRRTRFE